MTNVRFTALILLLTFLAACSKPATDLVAPAPPAQSQQALQWLTTPAKWIVEEAREQNTVYFRRSVNQIGDNDMAVEWVRFLPDGRFEAKLLDESTPIALFYKLNEATSELLLSETNTFTTTLSGRSAFSDISQNQVTLFINEGPTDVITLTLIPQP